MKSTSNGFSLVEVVLAIGVLSAGILSMCGLYTLGYRENRQSVEDVTAVAYADAYLAPLAAGLSATNMTWSEWCKIGTKLEGVEVYVWPAGGWAAYVRPIDNDSDYEVQNARSIADGAFGDVLSHLPADRRGSKPSLPSSTSYGLVVTRQGAVITLAFRAARRNRTLMYQPVVVNEIHFQGLGE